MKFTPRNDFVIFERVKRGQTPSGIIMPDRSLEGIDHIVRYIGPDVKDLKPGDKVMVMGGPGQDYGQLPNLKNFFLTKQANVAYVYEFEPKDFGEEEEKEKEIRDLPRKA